MKRTSLLILLVVSLMTLVMNAMSPEARRSFEAFERKAEAGDPEALYRLSAILEKGFDSIPADTARSLSLLRRSAAAGYAPAQNYLGFLFQNGSIIPADRDSAMYYIRLAADGGDPKAAHNIAFLILSDSISSRPDSLSAAMAMRYLRQAAGAGLPQSQTLLADLYAQGNIVPADTARAASLYEKAIASGFHDAEVRLLNMMGPRWMLYDSGSALREAVRFLNLGAPVIAAQFLRLIGPADPETPRAYALLGHAYSRGLGVPYDHRKANEYFARAAILGEPSAGYILSETLEIFPDAINDLLPDLPDSMSPESLREAAARAGIRSPEDATRALLAPL